MEHRQEERKKKKASVPIGDMLQMNESGLVEVDPLLSKKSRKKKVNVPLIIEKQVTSSSGVPKLLKLGKMMRAFRRLERWKRKTLKVVWCIFRPRPLVLKGRDLIS